MFPQLFPILLESGFLSPTHSSLIIKNCTARSNLTAGTKQVVCFDFTMTDTTNTTSWVPAAATASTASATGFFSNSVFGNVVLPPDDTPTKLTNKVVVYGISQTAVALTAPALVDVRVIGNETGMVKAASASTALGETFVATAGGTGTLSITSGTPSLKKIIAICSRAAGSTATALEAFVNGFGFGHDG